MAGQCYEVIAEILEMRDTGAVPCLLKVGCEGSEIGMLQDVVDSLGEAGHQIDFGEEENGVVGGFEQFASGCECVDFSEWFCLWGELFD